MKFGSLAAFAALAICLSGCAAIMKGSSEDIAVDTPATPGAVCTLSNAEGHWNVTTPGIAVVDRSKRDLQIKCRKDGWNEANAVAPSQYEPWTLGNLIIGGLVGIAIDAGTGSINRYPQMVDVPMTPIALLPASAIAPVAANAPVVTPATIVAGSAAAQASPAGQICTHQEQVQARIAKMNGYTGGPKCD